ncbi:DNA-binding transcriptional regulator, XRE-family HTH domain [Amycolatopsis xylanica]|uniref:DNA-binding transcriptional regulator, XRE-family HTH domain n=1 Tax=Amycolatopsis xylanica TaxID=589385 RepID=A0A1H3RGR6_9PSEU|nr:helix-turn-helix domain-containing protein [Amycolatopsis xylanica]SDZ24421.1 DNA-binding transcriptional regulator, XRE-family HTH domain [Amycolatopsis xylanica]
MVGVRRRIELVSARKAAGLTQEKLAEVMRVDRSTVIRWEAGEYAPLPFQWPKLARVLGRSTDEVRDLIDVRQASGPLTLGSELGPAFSWLDRHANWTPGTTRSRVEAQAPNRRAAQVADRRRVGEALACYYGNPPADHAMYQARCGQIEVQTSILTRPEWTELLCPLNFESDRVALVPDVEQPRRNVDEGAAVRRLAEAAADGVRIADVPIYRLVQLEAGPSSIAGKVGLAPFVEYALTADLLERELTDRLAAGKQLRAGSVPLRDRYLPDLAAVLDPSGRLCAGGVLALTAIARPADPNRGGPDYLLLVQERSGRVVNAPGRLAVIPKAFHRPLADQRADARIGATLRRELEKELFGRADVDNTAGGLRAADPMHPSRLSAPMRWLTEEPGRLRMECTGFGFNLVSGNYEFASVVVVDDEEFWPRFGGSIEANWEADGLRSYSTLDGDLIAELVADEAWTNEGLFALLQGLRRLSEIGGDRVKIPTVELSC